MYYHKWFFPGKIIEIIDAQTFIIWVDLGFKTWKRLKVKFNRIKPKLPDTNTAILFLEQNLKGKSVYCQIFKSRDYNGYGRYFAEIYVPSGDMTLGVKDINRNISNNHRIEGLVDFNDFMVSHGFSIYIQFKKEGSYDEFPVHNRSPWQHPNVRDSSGNSLGQGNQTDSSRGGPSPQG